MRILVNEFKDEIGREAWIRRAGGRWKFDIAQPIRPVKELGRDQLPDQGTGSAPRHGHFATPSLKAKKAFNLHR
jgi:hypothetical protein